MKKFFSARTVTTSLILGVGASLALGGCVVTSTDDEATFEPQQISVVWDDEVISCYKVTHGSGRRAAVQFDCDFAKGSPVEEGVSYTSYERVHLETVNTAGEVVLVPCVSIQEGAGKRLTAGMACDF